MRRCARFVPLAILTSACAAWEAPRRVAEPRAHVRARTPRSVSELHALWAGAAQARLRAGARWREAHLVPAGAPEFPDDAQLRLAAEEDPALAEYAALPAGARRSDAYVFDLSDNYQETREYLWRGAPARFKSDYLVHLAPAEAGGAQVEALQFRPRVHLGERFMLLGHHGPGRYDDVRFVGPTVGEREELLRLLLDLAR